jgi:dipeptide transport system ATP-binding protein
MADDVMVMYLGRPVEYGPREALFEHPRHPYTRALLSATPIADPTMKKSRIDLMGEPPSPIDVPPGCGFNPRCPLAFDKCLVERPILETKGDAAVACFAVDGDGRIRLSRAPATA